MIVSGKHKEETKTLFEYDIKKLMVLTFDGKRIEDLVSEITVHEPSGDVPAATVFVMSRKGMNILVEGDNQAMYAHVNKIPLPAVVIRCSCDDYSLNPCEVVQEMLDSKVS